MQKHNKLNIVLPQAPHFSLASKNGENVLCALANYFELTKPRLLFVVLLSAAVGFYLGSQRVFSQLTFALSVVATAFVGGGAMALNEYLERESDAKMFRTMNRPIPANHIAPERALIFGIAISAIGFLMFAVFVNWISFAFALATSVSYLFFYTPLKKKTSLATFVGAIPGALPPLIGWSGATGAINHQALSLFVIVFFWQIPHFLSIDWMYRSDYKRAGFPTLAVKDHEGKTVGRQMVVNMSALLCVSLLPTIFEMAGSVYFFGVFALGISFAGVILYALHDLNERARYVLRASVAYLTLLFVLIAIDKI